MKLAPDRVRALLSLAPGPHDGTLMDTSMVHDLAADHLALADALATAERERDASREAWATLAAAVRAERSAEAAHAEAAVPIDPRDAFASLLSIVEGGPPSPAMAALAAAGEAREAARHAVDALLSTAPAPSTVPAALVREYLAARDRYEAAWAPMLVHDGPPLSDEAVAAAIAGPDAEMDTARAALDATLGRCE